MYDKGGKKVVFEIDLEQIYSADELQDLLEEVLPLPDYYGRNLDALYDVLTDGRKEIWEIHFHNTEAAQSVLGKYVNSLKKMCRRAEAETKKLTVSFD